MTAKARRMETNLSTLGSGVIIFSVWTFIKFALSFLIYGAQIDKEISTAEKVILIIITWLIALLSFLIRFYIGKSARSESKGKQKRCFYLILAGFIALFEALAIIIEVYILTAITAENFFNIIMLLIIDTTSFVIILELIINAVGIRKQRKKEAMV